MAHEAKEAWKDVLRDYNRWRATGDENIKLALRKKIQKAKASWLAAVNSLDAEGLTSKLNEKFTQANFNKVSETEKQRLSRRLVEELSNTGLLKDEVTKWEQDLLGQSPDDLDAKRREILKHGGISSYLRYHIVGIEEILAANPSGYAPSGLRKSTFREQTLFLQPCWWLRLVCLVGLATSLGLILTAGDNSLQTLWGFVSFVLGAVACMEIDSIC